MYSLKNIVYLNLCSLHYSWIKHFCRLCLKREWISGRMHFFTLMVLRKRAPTFYVFIHWLERYICLKQDRSFSKLRSSNTFNRELLMYCKFRNFQENFIFTNSVVRHICHINKLQLGMIYQHQLKTEWFHHFVKVLFLLTFASAQLDWLKIWYWYWKELFPCDSHFEHPKEL